MDGILEKITVFAVKYKFVILLAVVGIFLMLLPGEKTEPKEAESVTAPEVSDVALDLEAILSQIQGVGKVRVMITQAAGEQTIYAYDEDSSDSGTGVSTHRDAVIITDDNRAETGLVLQIIPPIYQGAVVVCQGGDLPTVKLAVVDAVSAVTGLSADRITVLKMK